MPLPTPALFLYVSGRIGERKETEKETEKETTKKKCKDDGSIAETMERWVKEKVILLIPVKTTGSILTGALSRKLYSVA